MKGLDFGVSSGFRVLAKAAEDMLPQGPEAVGMGQHCATQLSSHRQASYPLPGLSLTAASSAAADRSMARHGLGSGGLERFGFIF